MRGRPGGASYFPHSPPAPKRAAGMLRCSFVPGAPGYGPEGRREQVTEVDPRWRWSETHLGVWAGREE